MTDTYTHNHVRNILKGIGVRVVGETYNDFLCLCPFHGNTETPSFSVSATKGLYLCFNPSCDVSGSLLELVRELTHRNDFEAMRYILSLKEDVSKSFEDDLSSVLEEKPEFVPFDQMVANRLYDQLNGEDTLAKDYVLSRGITQDSIDHFRLGYSYEKLTYPNAHPPLLTIPYHSPDGMLVGHIGRAVDGTKAFKNSKFLPTSKTLFNLHRAKRQGDTVIITESALDAIRIHQVGYPNVVATCGGHFSQSHVNYLTRFFQSIVIMTDFDKLQFVKPPKICRKCHPKQCEGHNPGRDLGMHIAESLKNRNVMWAVYGDGMVYPHEAKDAGDMTDAEIQRCLKNAINSPEYLWLNLY